MIKTIPGILLGAAIGMVSRFGTDVIPPGGVMISIIPGILAGNLISLPAGGRL